MGSVKSYIFFLRGYLLSYKNKIMLRSEIGKDGVMS